MAIGSLFSGIGGLELGLEWAGLGPVLWQVEINPFCRSVLARHWPEVIRHEDVRTVGSACLAPVDLICGGFPCQDVSSAGKGAGLAGERSGLWREFARVIDEMRPRWVVVENVASGAQRWVDAVVRDLERTGYDSLPVPLSASDVGAPHRRARIFVVAHANGEREPARAVDAEVGRTPAPATADAHGAELRQQPGGGGGADGRGAALAPKHRQHAGWPAQLDLVPPVRGVPGRVVRALGNSVVPQCAEVIGYVVRELAEATP
jgi:DNA (cytosine-5)-methyltransferase 1